MMSEVENATQLLHRLAAGDSNAAERLLPLVYDELRARAMAHFRHQPPDHTLQPTALVHEAFMRMIDQTRPPTWNDRAHFCAVAATAMRQILIDHARAKNAEKRGGDRDRVGLEAIGDSGSAGHGHGELEPVDLLALDDALKGLAAIDQRQARIVELRFFAGLSVDEVAEALGVSPRTVDLDWKMAKAWLSRTLSAED
jgi:RNA polymerase sigma factor (TIGR02999 family)